MADSEPPSKRSRQTPLNYSSSRETPPTSPAVVRSNILAGDTMDENDRMALEEVGTDQHSKRVTSSSPLETGDESESDSSDDEVSKVSGQPMVYCMTSLATEDQETSGTHRSLKAEAGAIVLQPNQPKYRAFPSKIYGKNRQRRHTFQCAWYDEWKWISYDERKEAVICHPCSMVSRLNLEMTKKPTETAFIEAGFSNWKDARKRFNIHERSGSHREACEKWRSHIGKKPSFERQPSSTHQKDQAESREAMLQIIQNLMFLAAQGLPVQGHDDDSNFTQLLQLRRHDSANLDAWLKRKQCRIFHTSVNIQNELLEVLARTVVRSIARKVHDVKVFGLVAEEITDCSEYRQVGIFLRSVDIKFKIHEDFVGFIELPEKVAAHTLTAVLTDSLLRFGLKISNLRGQCYDGASVVAAERSEVAKRIADIESRALCIHCCNHSLNLTVQDSSRTVHLIRDLLKVAKDVVDFVHRSPKRHQFIDMLQTELPAIHHLDLRPLCPMRYIVPAASLTSLKSNFAIAVEVLDAISSSGTDESASTAGRLLNQMESFEFIFGLEVAATVFTEMDNLSKLTASTKLTASDHKKAATLVADAIERRRTDEAFDQHFSAAMKICSDHEIPEPRLLRTSRRQPACSEKGDVEPKVLTVKLQYKSIFFQFLDRVVSGIRELFSQPGFEMVMKIESVLLLAKDSPTSFDHDIVTAICEFYGDDLQRDPLICDLEKLQYICKGHPVSTVEDIKACMLQLGKARHIFEQLCALLRLYFVLQGSYSLAERSSSALQRLKTYLRSTMTAKRINSCIIAHVHKDLTKAASPVDILREFSARNDSRRELFGKL